MTAAQRARSQSYAAKEGPIGHVFNQAKHNLDNFVNFAGGRPAAMEKIVDSVGQLPTGIYSGESAEIIRNIDGFWIGINGRVMEDGSFLISTAYIKAIGIG